MRITRRLKIKQNSSVQVHRTMVTWLEYQGSERYLLTRDFESTAEAQRFSARMNVPVEIETV